MVLNVLSKLSCLNLFGIIIFTNGNPAYRQVSYHKEPQYGLKELIEELTKQGKNDVISNQEDLTKITYNAGRLNNHYYNDEYRNAESYQSVRGRNSNYNNQPSVQNLNFFLRNNLRTEENNDETKDCMKKWGTCTELVWNYTDPKIPPRSYMGQGQEDDDDTETRNYSVNEDDVYLKPKNVLKFLNDLDKTLKLDGRKDIELRCYGSGCAVNRDDENRNSGRDDSSNRNYNYNNINENYDKHLRCNGNRCRIDDDKNYKDNLRCYGHRCSRKSNDGDDNNDVRNNEDGFYQDINHILRSKRDDSDRNGIDSFRCVGDRCSSNRNNDHPRNTLRCIGNRCSRDTDDRGDIYDRKDDRSRLRFVGVCRNRDDNEKDIYCTGNRYGRNRLSPPKVKKVPSDVVERVNRVFTKMLSSFRQVYYLELKERLNDLKKDVLEVILEHYELDKPSKKKMKK